MNSYEQETQTQRDMVVEDPHQFTKFLNQLFSIIGIDMDKTSINIHSRSLQDINRKMKSQEISENLYKLKVISYVFIYMNQLNLGYPKTGIAGCETRANDDPEYILCVSVKTKFLDESLAKKQMIIPYINEMLDIMEVDIVPSGSSKIFVEKEFNKEDKMISQFSRTAISPVVEFSNKKRKLRTVKKIPKTSYRNIELSVKDLIFSKIDKEIKNSNNFEKINYLEDLKKNFEEYIKGPMFLQIKNNPRTEKSKILAPFIKQYKDIIDLEEDEYYNNPVGYTILNSRVPKQKYIDNITEQVAMDLNKRLIQKLKNNNFNSSKEKQQIEYVLKNVSNIIKWTPYILKRKKIILKTAFSEKERYLTEYAIEYKQTLNDLVNDRKKQLEDEYWQDIRNQLKTKKNMQNLKL